MIEVNAFKPDTSTNKSRRRDKSLEETDQGSNRDKSNSSKRTSFVNQDLEVANEQRNSISVSRNNLEPIDTPKKTNESIQSIKSKSGKPQKTASVADIVQLAMPKVKKAPKGALNMKLLKGIIGYWRKDLNDVADQELMELAIFILKKNFDSRNAKDIGVLVSCLASIDFFQKYDQKTIEQCMKHMNHRVLAPGDTVFHINTVGTTFWVILKGSVGVWVYPREIAYEGCEDATQIRGLVEVRVLTPGSSFGELALMDDVPRSATIICKEECHFAVLEKSNFQNILAEKEAQKLAKEINFFASLPLFKEWTERSIRQFIYFAPIHKFSRGQKLYKEGDEPENMYIVRKGEFKILKDVELTNNLQPDQQQNAFDKFKRQLTRKKSIEVALLGPGTVFGEEELFLEKKREYTICCHSIEAEAHVIEKRIFAGIMLNTGGTSEFLEAYLPNKAHYYDKRIKELSPNKSRANALKIDGVSGNIKQNNILTKPSQIRSTVEILTRDNEVTQRQSPDKEIVEKVSNPQEKPTLAKTKTINLQDIDALKLRPASSKQRSKSTTRAANNEAKEEIDQDLKSTRNDLKITPNIERQLTRTGSGIINYITSRKQTPAEKDGMNIEERLQYLERPKKERKVESPLKQSPSPENSLREIKEKFSFRNEPSSRRGSISRRESLMRTGSELQFSSSRKDFANQSASNFNRSLMPTPSTCIKISPVEKPPEPFELENMTDSIRISGLRPGGESKFLPKPVKLGRRSNSTDLRVFFQKFNNDEIPEPQTQTNTPGLKQIFQKLQDMYKSQNEFAEIKPVEGFLNIHMKKKREIDNIKRPSSPEKVIQNLPKTKVVDFAEIRSLVQNYNSSSQLSDAERVSFLQDKKSKEGSLAIRGFHSSGLSEKKRFSVKARSREASPVYL